MNLKIRKATIADMDTVISFADELAQSDFPYEKEVDLQWAQSVEGKSYFKKRILEEEGICLLAEKGGNAIGYLTASINEPSSWRLRRRAEIENIYVREDSRGSGAGRELVNAFLQWAKEKKAKSVFVNVYSLNGSAVAFYTKTGFMPFETILAKDLP